MDQAASGLLRALCFHDAWGYPPTRVEWIASFDVGTQGVQPSVDVATATQAVNDLILQGSAIEFRGRVVFPGKESLIGEHEKREAFFPRKLRRARRVAAWLSRLSGVRFVALCNTTALSHARDGGDLDFFVVTKHGTLWQTRGWATLPFKLLGRRPRTDGEVSDAVCLSFFVDDAALDLSALQIPDDIYFRHWFLSLLPLFDDGISGELWKANVAITERHPFARPWVANPEVSRNRPHVRLPSSRYLDPAARRLQTRAFSTAIKSSMNQDTRVVVNDHVLKFHTEDGRVRYREEYGRQCKQYGVAF